MGILNKVYSEYSLDFTGGLNQLNNVSKSENPCIVLGEIKGISIVSIDGDDYGNVSPLKEYNLKLNVLGDFKNDFYILRTYGGTNSEYSKINNIPYHTLKKLDGNYYLPKIGDTILSKVNPENGYIIELFSTKGKSIDEINKEVVLFKNPICKTNIETNNNNFSKENINSNYYIYSIILLAIICIALIFKLLIKNKK